MRVSNKGSKPQYVTIEVQGVSISDIIDTGADITIIGGARRLWPLQGFEERPQEGRPCPSYL